MRDLRLDWISNIEQPALDLMTDIRAKYIALDQAIQDLEKTYPQIDNEAVSGRTIALGRTNLETSLQFIIKSLCLAGEIK